MGEMVTDVECPLSDREREVLELVATGATNQQIARDLYISVNTVKVHLRNVFTKLEVTSRTEATMVALREGWVAVDGVVSEDEVTEPVLTEVVRFEPLPVESLSWPRRILLVGAAVVLTGLLLWVRTPGLRSAAGPGAELTDRSATMRPVLPAEAPRWTERTPLTLPRARLALANYEEGLYAIGGDTADGIIGETARYDLQRNTWSLVADKPTAVANVQAAVLDGLVYVPGGYTTGGMVTDRVEVYDPQTDGWSSIAPLPAARCAYGLTAFQGCLYLFGGWDGQSYARSVYRYDPRADVWAEETSLDAPRGFLGAASLAQRMYVIGGYDGVREYSLCQTYEPQVGWGQCASMGVGRGGLGVAVVGNRLYAIGGGISGDWDIVSNEWYDPTRDAWTSFETPIMGEWRNPGVATDGASLFAVGGWSGEYLAHSEEYQALFRMFLPAAP